jgi:ACT domain-containing protein
MPKQRRQRVQPDRRRGTVTWACRELGISRTAFYRYAEGRRPIPSAIAEKFAQLNAEIQRQRKEE